MKKGFVFTTDAVFAVMIAMVIAATTSYYIFDIPQNPYRRASLMRAANDIGLSLDRGGILSSNNKTLITKMLNLTTPSNMVSNVEIQRYYEVGGNFTVIQVIRCGEDDIETNYLTQEVISTDMKGGYYNTRVRVGLR